MIESIFIFCLGACVSLLGMIIYNIKKTKQFLCETTLKMTDYDIKCMNHEYVRRKSNNKKTKQLMTNRERYSGQLHNHYVYERMCPKCNSTVCGREPSDFRECSIKDKRDYEQWLKEFD